MAESEDAHGSGPCESNLMGVQVSLPTQCLQCIYYQVKSRQGLMLVILMI